MKTHHHHPPLAWLASHQPSVPCLALLLLLLLFLQTLNGQEINSQQDQQQLRQERRYDTRHLGVGNHIDQQQEQQRQRTVEYVDDGDIDKDVDEYEDNNGVVFVDVSGGPTTQHRGLVPQLWPNYTGVAEPAPEDVSCDEAQMKCAYRAGCGLALQNYVLGCMELAQGKTKTCNTHCRHSLIALMSTHEGQRLMKCNCTGDSFCNDSKRNLAQCQDEVLHATRADTVVTCSAAQWICAADPLCSTALDYYHNYCGAMFAGRKCTERCENSIRILKRQQAATKLETCQCDGTENFECHKVKDNMQRLCFLEIEENGIDDTSSSGTLAAFKDRVHKILILVSLIVSALASLIYEVFHSSSSSSSMTAARGEIGKDASTSSST